jgi:hypothetical protein
MKISRILLITILILSFIISFITLLLDTYFNINEHYTQCIYIICSLIGIVCFLLVIYDFKDNDKYF